MVRAYSWRQGHSSFKYVHSGLYNGHIIITKEKTLKWFMLELGTSRLVLEGDVVALVAFVEMLSPSLAPESGLGLN